MKLNDPRLRSIRDQLPDEALHQEHVFRDADQRIGLHRHHGYGKQKVANVSVVDRREKLAAQARRLRERKTEIYTVDVDLDQIMTAYKVTFLNLCQRLMPDHLGVPWQIDHLIRAVLTLPGRRRQTPRVETIEIFRQERDPEAMAAVERACDRLTAEEIVRQDVRAR